VEKYRAAIFYLVLLSLLCAVPAVAASHWGYSGEFNPENWHKADPSYALCNNGKNQTPINIEPQYQTKLPPIKLTYTHKGQSLINNGHSIQVEFPANNTMTVGQQTFTLLQAHFHAPGENQLKGKSYPMEGHFVHKDGKGNLAVLAVFFFVFAENSNIASLWKSMPQKAGENAQLSGGGFDGRSILPAKLEYIYFNGSLTTPPCGEGVRWYVLKKAQTVSKQQVAKFTSIVGVNNRPLQPVNARPVLE
jgi:carbonic anhydrase